MMNKDARSPLWSELQPELLGLVLLWLPSLVDRIRLRAVCRPWRSNAQLQPLPPPLPWLTLFDGTFLSIPDGKIIRMPTPDDAFCCGSIGSWLFFVRSDGGCSLTNPFSKATLNLPKLSIKWFDANSIYGSRFHKLLVPSPLESSPSGSLAVALILDNGRTIRICQPPIATDLSIGRKLGLFSHLYDIAFFSEKLYGVGMDDKLSMFEINYGIDSKRKITCVQCVTNSPSRIILPKPLSSGKSHMKLNYLVECCGRLLMVMRMIECTDDMVCDRTAAFEVFEADLSTKPGRWRCILKLDGQALFVGKYCSRSFPAGECYGIQEDCIYFMDDYREVDADPLHDSGVYNMRNGTITPLLSENAARPQYLGGQWRPTWLFPADAM